MEEDGDVKEEWNVKMTNIHYVNYDTVSQQKSKNKQNNIFCSECCLSPALTAPFCKKKK